MFDTFQVPGNLIISAHSGAHSFDSSKMNMSHVVSHLSFGRMFSPRLLTDMRRLLPYIGQSHDKLNEKAFINQHEFGANVTVSPNIPILETFTDPYLIVSYTIQIEHYLQVVKTEVITRRTAQEHSLVEEYEYTAHSSIAQTYYLPVAKFHFELSPMQVQSTSLANSSEYILSSVQLKKYFRIVINGFF